MGLPSIEIIFKQKAVSAIKRSERGITCVIVRDDTQKSGNNLVINRFKYESDIDAKKFTAENVEILKRCFYVSVNQLVVVSVPKSVATFDKSVQETLNKLKFNYICTTIEDWQDSLVSFIKSYNKVSKGKKVVGVVYNGTTTDSMFVINVKNPSVTEKKTGKTVQMVEYLPRITSVIANLPLNRSCTYYVLDDLASVDTSFVTLEKTMDNFIDEGCFCLINDTDDFNNEVVKIGRGVNSLKTLTSTETEDMKKIIIVDSMNLILEDIYRTFKEYYVGKYKNCYDNQALFITSINAYFRYLQEEEILDPIYYNHAFVDVEQQRLAWLSIGKEEANDWDEAKVKAMAFKSFVFLAGKIKIMDAIEDLKFTIFME